MPITVATISTQSLVSKLDVKRGLNLNKQMEIRHTDLLTRLFERCTVVFVTLLI